MTRYRCYALGFAAFIAVTAMLSFVMEKHLMRAFADILPTQFDEATDTPKPKAESRKADKSFPLQWKKVSRKSNPSHATHHAAVTVVPLNLEPIRWNDLSESDTLATAPLGKEILVHLENQEAVLTDNGSVVKTYRISSGDPSTPTPQGTFRIYQKQELRVSGDGIPYRMPNYMAFTENGAYGLHGLPYLGSSPTSSSYWQEAQDHIGHPVSHGCVRLLPQDAAELYDWAEVGTPVIIQM